MKISYFLNPNIGYIHSFLPTIFSEIAGVLHSKLFISDDTTIITGYLSYNNNYEIIFYYIILYFII